MFDLFLYFCIVHVLFFDYCSVSLWKSSKSLFASVSWSRSRSPKKYIWWKTLVSWPKDKCPLEIDHPRSRSEPKVDQERWFPDLLLEMAQWAYSDYSVRNRVPKFSSITLIRPSCWESSPRQFGWLVSTPQLPKNSKSESCSKQNEQAHTKCEANLLYLELCPPFELVRFCNTKHNTKMGRQTVEDWDTESWARERWKIRMCDINNSAYLPCK